MKNNAKVSKIYRFLAPVANMGLESAEFSRQKTRKKHGNFCPLYSLKKTTHADWI
jgi:hypothetical protein